MADSEADAVQSPIIMKVDGPDDEKEREENEDNERSELDINPSQVCFPARPLIATSKFGSPNPFAVKSNNILNRSVLRPSQLGQPKPFALTPSKLNPFKKEEVTPGKANGDAPKFMPLLTSDKSKDTSQPNVPVTPLKEHSFVFGQNLQERVIAEGTESDEPKPSTSLSSNGTSDMLFSNAVKDIPVKDLPTPSKSLSECAREYEELRSNKRKYEEVEVFTGEEDETNISHVSCKLFAYDKTVGNWQERGRGILRLNDQEVKEDDVSFTQSRLVFRTSGVLRVGLNTKIWADMTAEKSSAKSIRFTGIDGSGEVRVYLLMASPEEVNQLLQRIGDRILNEQKRQNQKKSNRETLDNATTTSSETKRDAKTEVNSTEVNSEKVEVNANADNETGDTM